jgi:high-affinity iron transporter
MLTFFRYWLGVILAFGSLGFYEKRGHFPFLKAKSRSNEVDVVDSDDQSSQDHVAGDKGIHVSENPA